MTVKEIVCPHCRKPLPPAGGFIHDDAHNILCSHCNGIVFGATKQAEDKVRSALNNCAWHRKDCLPIKINPQANNFVAPVVASSPSCNNYECD